MGRRRRRRHPCSGTIPTGRQTTQIGAGKPNPEYYAQRTVDVASAWLWLKDGLPIADVITMLPVRRRSQIPDKLCYARAHGFLHDLYLGETTIRGRGPAASLNLTQCETGFTALFANDAFSSHHKSRAITGRVLDANYRYS